LPFAERSFLACGIPVLLIAALLVVQGCGAAAVACGAYGVSKIASPAATAQPAQPAAQRTYPEYLTEMERINTEREKAGLQPRPILTREEWVSAQAASSQTAPPPAAPAAEPSAKAAEIK